MVHLIVFIIPGDFPGQVNFKLKIFFSKVYKKVYNRVRVLPIVGGSTCVRAQTLPQPYSTDMGIHNRNFAKHARKRSQSLSLSRHRIARSSFLWN